MRKIALILLPLLLAACAPTPAEMPQIGKPTRELVDAETADPAQEETPPTNPEQTDPDQMSEQTNPEQHDSEQTSEQTDPEQPTQDPTVTETEQTDPEKSDDGGEDEDIIYPKHLTYQLWNTLDIASHPWVNQADYDFGAGKWIMHDRPDTLNFRHKMFGLYSPKFYFFMDNYQNTFVITASGKDYFFLYRDNLTKCYSDDKKQIDTTRVIILDTVDQMDEPDASFWYYENYNPDESLDPDNDDED
jgi:hypothetical protein